MSRLPPPFWLAPLSCWLIGLWMAVYPMLLSGLALIPGDPGDARFNHYVLEHSYRWLIGAPGRVSFWDMPFYFPAPNVAAYGDVLLGVAPLYWLCRAVQLPPDTSFQFWQMLVLSINFFSAYLLLRRLFACAPWPSALGALLFAFGSPRMVHFLHPQLLPQFFTVLAVYAGGRVLAAITAGRFIDKRPQWYWMSVGCLAFILQWYSSFYYGWLLTLAAGIAAIWSLMFRQSRELLFQALRFNLLPGICSTAAAALLLYPLAKQYHSAAKLLGLRDFGHVHRYLPRPAAWLYMGKEHWLYGKLAEAAAFRTLPLDHEQQLGIGFITTLLVLLGFWAARRNLPARIACLSALTFLVLCTVGPDGRSLWSFVYLTLPGAGAVRAVSRAALVLLAVWALGLALFFESAMAGRKSNRQVVFGFIFAALVVFEQGRRPHTYDKHDLRRQAAILAEGLKTAGDCESFFYSSWQGRQGHWKYQLDAMWASLRSGIPTLNGYSGNSPPGWPLEDNRVHNRQDILRLRTALHRWTAQRGLNENTTCWLRRYADGDGAAFRARPISASDESITGSSESALP